MRTTIRNWFWAWEFDKEETWLDEMSAQGKVLVSARYATYEFEDCAPGEYAVRLEMLEHNPASEEGKQYIAFVEEKARGILLEQLENHPTLSIPERWYGTGGTFTTLAAIVRSVHWTERTYMHGTVLTLEQVESSARALADMPIDVRREQPGLQPNRADIIVHGMCILLACMRTLGIGEIVVSEYGNLEGYVRMTYGG